MKIENIKFKAKRLDNGEWIIGSFVVMKVPALSKTTIGIIVESDGSTLHEIDPTTVCQFTGLIDCEGNEIWEHDLIHFVGRKPTAEVFWSEEDYAFVAASENEPLYLLPHVLEVGKIERVGNKFDKK
uniref:YopX family protein n=1 Tax=Prevotella sp. TaxID=59823 RepID=UPI0025E40C5C